MNAEVEALPQRADLRNLIRNYVDLDIDPGLATLTRAAPVRPQQVLQLTLEGRQLLRNVETGEAYEPPRATLIGLCTHRRYNLEVSGRLRLFGIHLQPAVLNAWTGMDMRPLTDSCLKNYGGWHELDDLIAALARARDLAARVDIADEWFGALAMPQLDVVASAARRIRDSCGRAAFDRSVHGLSARQFQRRFARQVGVTPKLYARLCRLSAVIDMRDAQPGCSWTDLAHANGYADQAHLTREFRTIVREAPSQFNRIRLSH